MGSDGGGRALARPRFAAAVDQHSATFKQRRRHRTGIGRLPAPPTHSAGNQSGTTTANTRNHTAARGRTRTARTPTRASRRKKGSYDIEFVNASTRKAESIFSILSPTIIYI